MRILKIPEIESEDYHSQSMFILSYRVYILGLLVFSTFMLLHIKDFGPNFWISLTLTILSISALWYMKRFGKHLLISKITIIVATAIIQYNIYSLNNPDRFIDLMWIIIIVLYGFYTINIYWGIVILVTNFIGLILYQALLSVNDYDKLNEGIKPLSEFSTKMQIDYYLSAVLGCLLISYLLILFFKTQNITNLKFRVTNKKLRENNKIVIQQNHEKTVMLKEIHHRVKNNLQVITSLLRLQSKDIDDPEIIRQFKEATNRVIAMSLIHEKIYQTKDLSKIDISSYFRTLTNELIRSYSVEIPIETNIKADLRFITPDYMVPLALLLNELTSNSLKHGFKDKTNGSISIELRELGNVIEFFYSDNGHWDGKDDKISFGLELIDTLTEQLDGNFEREIDDGTFYRFNFPNNL